MSETTGQLSIALRPRRFSRIVGQEMPVRLLRAMVDKQAIPRCVLLSGPCGVGKTTLARIFAAYVNCDNRQGDEPCGECYHCQSIMNSQSSIVIECEAATHRKVEDMDAVRELVAYTVPEGKRRVVIVDEFHTVSDTAQESLLHLLEAHASDTTFVLTTTRKKSINDAILSRALPVPLNDISFEERVAIINQYFNDYGLQVDPGVTSVIARAKYGLRAVWQLVDKMKLDFDGKKIEYEQALDVLGLLGGARLEAVTAALARSLMGAVEKGGRLQKSGVEWTTLLDSLFMFAEDSIILTETGEVRPHSGVSEKFLESTPWSRFQCMTFMETYHELTLLDWKSGIPRAYAALNRTAAPAAVQSGTTVAPVASKAVSLVDKVNADPVWAQICRYLGGGRVVEATV